MFSVNKCLPSDLSVLISYSRSVICRRGGTRQPDRCVGLPLLVTVQLIRVRKLHLAIACRNVRNFPAAHRRRLSESTPFICLVVDILQTLANGYREFASLSGQTVGFRLDVVQKVR